MPTASDNACTGPNVLAGPIDADAPFWSSEFLSSALAGAGVGIWQFDMETGLVTWDSTTSSLFGLENVPVTTGALLPVHEEDQPRIWECLQHTRNTSEPYDVTFRALHSDGGLRWFRGLGNPFPSNQANPRYIAGIVRDITERSRAYEAAQQRETRLSNIFEQALVGIMEATPDGRPIMINNKFCEILGRTAEELQGCDISDYTHPDDLKWNLPLLAASAEQNTAFQTEKRYLRPDGSSVWCKVNVSFVRGSSGEAQSAIVLAEDISDKKKAEEERRTSELLYRSILEASADCIKVIDLQGRVQLINEPGLLAMEIGNSDSVQGALWADLWPAESRSLVQSAFANAIAGEVARFSAFRPTTLGTPRWWDVVVTPMLDDQSHVIRLLSISRDITVQRSAAAEVKHASEHDALTGLANRRAFEARLQASTIRAMQRERKVGLLLLDLDHFKHINDTLGHAAGDHLLSVFGKRLQQCVRRGDFVARLGGDEFAVIIEGGERELDLPAVGQSVLARLQEPIAFEDRLMSAGASIGGALFPSDAQTANQLFEYADIALYALKESGRGGTRMFHPQLRQEAQLVSSQLSLARNAITHQSVEPHYQQKVDLSTGRIAGFEALLRWHHVTRGIQSPDTVAEAFKDYELASRIGDLMQGRVFSDMRAWLNRDLPIGFVAINAAPVEFLRDDFSERLVARMREHDIPPHLVEIEVTEHAFGERGSDFVGRALRELSRAGVRIALDDFGTGSSSLSHLRDYPVDVVKIDRSFIDKVTTDPEVSAIVCAVIDLAKSLHIEVVAEGVETLEQMNFLVGQACEMGQGYLFGRAIQARDVPSLLAVPRLLTGIAC